MGAEKADTAPGRVQAAPSSFLGRNLPIQGNQHSIIFLEHAFCYSSWCLPPYPPAPPDVISVTHKPNILALNFTHQNKDEKNFVDTVVLLGVLTRQELATALLSSGAGPLHESLFLELGWLRLQGPRGEAVVIACKGKEE